MNCEKCQELISEYIDSELDSVNSFEVQTHIDYCEECSEIYVDFSTILAKCDFSEESAMEVEKPNSQAIWCRINNAIETEIKPELVKIEEEKLANASWFEKLYRNSLRLSFSQTVAAVLFVALMSSLLTLLGIRNYSTSNELTANSEMSPNLVERVLGRIGVIETSRETREKKVKQQEELISYWNQRVDARKAQWNSHLREAFERNLREIDQVVYEYSVVLEENPQDELSGEMLDSALSEKMELLRGFSEL
jgi:Putative zinc-finger